MALKNSDSGTLPVSEIYKFMMGKFPYFKTAPDGWKVSVNVFIESILRLAGTCEV